MKIIICLSILFFCGLVYVSAQTVGKTFTDPDINSYNIRSIGVVSQGFPFKIINKNIYNEYLENPDSSNKRKAYFKDYWCKYLVAAHTCPAPSSPCYKRKNSKSEIIALVNPLITDSLTSFLNTLGYVSIPIHASEEVSLKIICDSLAEKNIDGLLFVRYLVSREMLNIGTCEKRIVDEDSTVEWTVCIGNYMTGIGLIPCFELYDTRSHNLVWTSFAHFENELELPVADRPRNILFTEKGEYKFNQDAGTLVTMLKKLNNFPKPSTDVSARADSTILMKQRIRKYREVFWNTYLWHRQKVGFGVGYVCGNFPAFEAKNYSYPFSEPGPLDYRKITAPSGFGQGFNIDLFNYSYYNLRFSPLVIGAIFGTVPVSYVKLDDDNQIEYKTRMRNVSTWIYSFLNFDYQLRLNDLNSIYAGLSYVKLLTDYDQSYYIEHFRPVVKFGYCYNRHFPLVTEISYMPDVNKWSIGIKIFLNIPNSYAPFRSIGYRKTIFNREGEKPYKRIIQMYPEIKKRRYYFRSC